MKINKTELFYSFLVLQPFVDLITSLMTRFFNYPITLGMLLRGAFLIVIVSYTVFCNKNIIKYLLSIFLFAFLYFSLKGILLSDTFFITELTYMFKYFYFPIVMVCFVSCYSKLELDKKIVMKIFVFDIIIYAFFIIFPSVVSINFSSYGDYGVGSVGLFYAANEIGAILSLLSPFIYILLYKNKFKLFFIFDIVVLIAMMMIGTKVCLLSMLLTEFVFLLYFIIKKNNIKHVIISLFMLVFSFVVIPFIPVSNNINASVENNIIKEEVNNDNLSGKIINILLSGRQVYLRETYNISKSASLQDKLFGIGFSNRDVIGDKRISKLIEIDFLDVFFHYGLLGFIIYFLPLIIYFIKLLKKLFGYKESFSFYNLLYFYTILLLLGISSVAGHVLGSPSVSIYLALVFVLLDYGENNKKSLKEDEITILALHLNYGGVEQYISSLCKMLEEKYKINIITTYKILDKPAFYFSDKVKISYLINYGPNKKNLISSIKNKKIISLLKESYISLKILYLKRIRNINAIKNINSKYIITTRYFHSSLVGKYADKNIIKIATEHNYHNNDKKYINRVVNSVVNFDYFVLVSNNLREFYKDKVKAKCMFIPNVIDNLPCKSTNLKHNNIINIGRLEKEKGQSDLIDIVYELKKSISDIKLYLIGDGSLREELEEKVKSYSLVNNVIFTGFISKKEIEKYLIKSKLFVMTSFTESFGIVLIESMSYKVPCIAYDCADGARELLKNGNGILVKDRNKNDMINEIKKILNNQKELEKISLLGYNHCKEYLIDNVKEQWLKIVK